MLYRSLKIINIQNPTVKQWSWMYQFQVLPRTLGNYYAHLMQLKEKAENRDMIKVILSSVRYLGRQSLPLHGQYKVDYDTKQCGEIDSNLILLLRTRAEDKSSLLRWIEKSPNKFIFQISKMRCSASWHMILRELSSEISGKWYTIMVDRSHVLSLQRALKLLLLTAFVAGIARINFATFTTSQ